MRRGRLILVGVVAALGFAAVAAYAALPGTTVPPDTVGTGFLAGATRLEPDSVAELLAGLKRERHGSDAVLQHARLESGQSTGWHTHPGPVIVLVVSGQLDYYDADDPCRAISYSAGTGFVDTGFGNVHKAVAQGRTDFYPLYLLPKGTETLRIDAAPPEHCA